MTIGIQQSRPPFVQFETRALPDPQASEAEGRQMYRNVDFALITPAGSRDVVEKICTEWLAQIKRMALGGNYDMSWSQHFEGAYRAWKEGNEIPEHGTDLKMWAAVTPADIAQCHGANVRTVEDLADANEQAIQRIGPNGRYLKDKAKAYLAAGTDAGKLASENANLKAKVTTLEESLARMQEQIDALKPRRGRPPKEESEE